MMTEAVAVNLIDEQFRVQWPSLAQAVIPAGVPFVFDNDAIPTRDYLALCAIVHTVAPMISVGTPGTRRVERRGYIMVKLWVPANKDGRSKVSGLADAARSVFKGTLATISSGVPGDEPIIVSPGASKEIGTDGNWFMLAVTFPFRYYTLE